MITFQPIAAAEPRGLGMPFIMASLRGLFFVSGVSGLVYEVVWVRMLTRILGNTVSATAIVLSAFMAGLGLGSILIGRYADRLRRPLLAYGMLELSIGAAAAFSLGLPGGLLLIYRALYLWVGQSLVFLSTAQIAIASLFMLLPTALMGATFPTLCSFGNRRHSDFARHVGTLYALNAFGAIAGVLLAGFVSIGEVGETNTVLIGVALNGLVALFAIALSRASEWTGYQDPESGPGTTVDPRYVRSATLPTERRRGRDDSAIGRRRVVLMTTGASGFVAMASQVVWGRMLLLYQGTSIYSFSAMLAVILAGMGIGSLVAGRVVGQRSEPLRFLAELQVGIGLITFISLGLFGLGDAVRPDLSSGQHLYGMVLAPLLLLGPLGFFWGALFPAAAYCYAGGRTSGGRVVADLYAYNTLGCIAGAIGAGFVLIPGLGVSATAMALAAGSGFLSLVILSICPNGLRRASWTAGGCLIVGLGPLLVSTWDPYRMLLARKIEREFPGPVQVYRYEESSAGTVTAFSTAGNPRAGQLWIDGEGMTVLVSVTKLMAHLPLWLADDPKEALVICFGMGTTVRSASRHKGLEIWAVDRTHAVFESFQYFHPEDSSLLHQPNVHAIVDDGRNFLLINPRKYDMITVDPAPPIYSAGAAGLYSREFFRLCYARLRPRGVMCLWVPQGNASEVKAIMRSFFDVFPEATIWNSPLPEVVDGCYLIGARQPIRGVAEQIRRGFLDRAVVTDLTEWGNECDSPEKILDLLVVDSRRMAPRLEDVPVITDDRPYTEFPLWRALFQTTDYAAMFSGERLRRQFLTTSGAKSPPAKSNAIEFSK